MKFERQPQLISLAKQLGFAYDDLPIADQLKADQRVAEINVQMQKLALFIEESEQRNADKMLHVRLLKHACSWLYLRQVCKSLRVPFGVAIGDDLPKPAAAQRIRDFLDSDPRPPNPDRR